MKGIRFGNYHSYDDFSLILSQKTISAPSPKVESIEIPGGDGVLDLTDFFGEVKYNNRELSFEFSCIVPQDEFLELFSRIQNAIHGQKMRIVLDDDPEWYYIGRVTVPEWKTEKSIGRLTIVCDCEPYKYSVNDSNFSHNVTDKKEITLSNGRMKVVPTITTSAEMTIAFGNYRGTFSKGTFIIPELELAEGNTIVTVTGTGTITFTYRKGAL